MAAGIAGLTTAIALRKRRIRAEVYEEEKKWEPLGAGILVPCNAMRGMRRLGLAASIESRGVRMEKLEIRDDRNRLLQIVDLKPFEETFGASTVALRRSELHEILRSAVPANDATLNQSCSSVRAHGTGQPLAGETTNRWQVCLTQRLKCAHERFSLHLWTTYEKETRTLE